MKYALFMGCTPYGATPEVKMSLEAVAAKLGIELIELTEASCCGATHLQDLDDFLALTLNARNLCYAQELGLDLVTVCNTCQLVLSRAAERLKNDAALLAKVNAKLSEIDLEYHAGTRVRHLLYVLRDDVGFANIPVTDRLSGRAIAPFYGCHNLRGGGHSAKNAQGENPYAPTSLDELITALGATCVDYAHKNQCCGFHTEIQAPKTTYTLSGNALTDATDRGAQMIVTPCPLCHLSLDVQQSNAAHAVQEPINMPVLHLTQMIGLAMGIDETSLGLKHNIVRIK